MSTTDAFSIVPQGVADTGEAAIVDSGHFLDFSKQVLQLRLQQINEQKKKDAEVGKLLNDEVKAKWAKDNIEYFQPKMQEIRQMTKDLYRKRNGRLTDMDLFEIQSKYNELKADALASNSLYENELKLQEELDKDPQSKTFDVEASSKLRRIYNDPYKYGFGDAIKQAGGIVKWRAQNEQAFKNIGAYSMAADIQSEFKDKTGVYYERNEDGSIKWKDQGDFWEARGEKRVDPEKLKLHYSQFWDRNNYQGRKFRNESHQWVSHNIKLNEDGFLENATEDGMKLYNNISSKVDLSKYTPEQRQEILARQYGMERVDSEMRGGEQPLFQGKRKDMNINVGGGESGKAVTDLGTSTHNLKYSQDSTGKLFNVTGKSFSTTPVKSKLGLTSRMIDPTTNEPVKDVGNVDIESGNSVIMPVVTGGAPIELYEKGKKVMTLKPGQIISDELISAIEADPKLRNRVKYGIYAIGSYDTQAGKSLILGPGQSPQDTKKDIYIPLDIIKNSALLSLSDKEKELYEKRIAELVSLAEEKNIKNGSVVKVNRKRTR